MRNPPSTGTRDASSLRELLFDGKTQVRAVHAGDVSRRPLIESSRASGARIVTVTAAAGYGKSTLLAEWASLEDRRVAWTSIDRFDDDPSSLLTALAFACAALSPRALTVAAEMRGIGTSVLGRSAPMLGAVLARVPEPFVLFVDDIHSAGSAGCQDAMEVVLSGVPEGSQVVLAGRYEQPYLARLRAHGTTHEIRSEDLRIDASGARTIFDAAGVEASSHEIGLAVERCEGWPTGLFLCALATSANTDVLTPSGSDRFVADYLYRECLSALPDDLQAFLRRTAVLEELSAPLCDVVLGRSDSKMMLRRLEALNLFLVPLDSRREWFRYHMLFREFLLEELTLAEKHAVPDLHLRAAAWFESHDAHVPAIEHLLAAPDHDRAAALITEHALDMYQHGMVAVIDRWLSQLGDRVVESSPWLAVLATWVAILQGKSPASERLAAALHRIEPGGTDVEVVAFESSRAMIRAAMCVDGAERALADARFAVASEPEGSRWRDQALHLLGSTQLLVGDSEAARQSFTSASVCAKEAGNADSVILSEAELAILAIGDNDWNEAEKHAREAVRTIDDSHMEGYPTTALALAVRARIALRQGDAKAAEHLLARSMRARVHCTHVLPYLAMRARLQLAKLHAEMSDHTAGLHMLREIDEIRARRPRVGLLEQEIDRLRQKLTDSSGRLGSVPLTPAEVRILPYLQTHLTIAEIGDRLYVSRHTVSTQVGSIYRKLGVTTRAGAVERATEIGLLGD